MGREIDESWIEEAIGRYERFQRRQGEFGRAVSKVDVTVRSPDGLVEVVVAADGVIRDVTISDAAQGRDVRELSAAVRAAVAAAADAARWARARLHQDIFGEFPELGGSAAGSAATATGGVVIGGGAPSAGVGPAQSAPARSAPAQSGYAGRSGPADRPGRSGYADGERGRP